MNQENLHINKSTTDVETLETQEQLLAALESKESGQEFANRILEKIKGYMDSFLNKKEALEKIEKAAPLDDPTIKEQIKSEMNLDNQLDEIDHEAEKIKTEASENVNSAVREFSKSYHHPKYRNEVAKKIVEARNTGQDAEAVRSGFYDKTEKEKGNFESQEKERSISEIMKEKDMVIVHAIPLFGETRGSQENNPMLKAGAQQNINFEDSVEMISALSPTISTSIPSPDRHNNGLYKKSGVILGEGKVLSAVSQDSGSVAHGLYKRIPKYVEEQHTAIQSEIDLEKTSKRASEVGQGAAWNELTVEKPEIAGLFYDLTEVPLTNPNKDLLMRRSLNDGSGLTEEDIDRKWQEEREYENYNLLKEQKFALEKMKKHSEKMGVPLYAFKNENGELKKYKVEFLPQEYTHEYLENVLAPKGKKILAETGNNPNAQEYREFYEKEYLPVKESLSPLTLKYDLVPVTAKDIYESKKTISDEERKRMVEDIKSKGILSDSAEKEVDKKFQGLH